MTGTRAQAQVVQFVTGSVVFLLLWEAVGRTELWGPTWPPLSNVFGYLLSDSHRALFGRAATATALSAAQGLVLGAGAALVLAALHSGVPGLRRGLDRFAGVVHATPLIGIAPVLVVTVGRAGAPVAVATMACFFPAYAAASSAFEATKPVHHDLFDVLGSGHASRLLRLQLPAALPGLLDAVRLASPGAVLGSILGEWFGAPRGVGLIIISSAQNFQILQLWAAALLGTAMSLGIFAALSTLQYAARRRLS